ncbi:MAG: AbrB/MazE/SpoVT family DNA-binding domain-containing protein [Candidatus Magasanikbacteria bacterium]|nr:AbrB/MazE/SpoVT family DNA-binding domain-containing protein [Candidatus Magasanikbacteria bacterium]
MSKFNSVCPKFAGTTTLGERGQIVIPKEIRQALKLQDGQKFIVAVHNGAIILVLEKQMQKIFSHLTKILNK